MLIIIAIGISYKIPPASSDSGSLTGLYTPSPDLANMSLNLSDTFGQVLPNSTKDLHLEFFDAKNNTLIKNVSFFMNTTKDGKVLMNDLFYTETGSMTIKFSPGNNTGKWIVNGSNEPTLGGWMSENGTLPIAAPVFTEKGVYHIHFAVLALVYVNGLVDPNNHPTFDSWWSVDEKGNVSKYDNSTTTSFVPTASPTGIKNESPLKQFKSVTLAQDVKCNQNFQLVIKSENGSPACIHPSSMARMVRQGWWVWDKKVGNTVVNTPDKKPFDIKNCTISETVSSIVGTRGFVKDDLPVNGITYPGENMSSLVGQVTQFSIRPNSEGYITFTYDFNPYPGSNCIVTAKDAMTYIDMARSNTPISNTTISDGLLSNFFIVPDIFEVDKTKVRTDVSPLGDSGDVQVKLASVEDINDHVVKTTFEIISSPTSQIGKSYFVGFWWHSGVVVTIGNDLYNGTAFSGPRFG